MTRSNETEIKVYTLRCIDPVTLNCGLEQKALNAFKDLDPSEKKGYAYTKQYNRTKARYKGSLETSSDIGIKGFPVYAQQYYTSPFGATGTAVCGNCHLSTLTAGLNLPTSLFPDTVFESVLSVPLPKASFQISEIGTLNSLNVGGFIVLPRNFSLPAKTRLPRSLSRKTKGSFIQPYTKEKTNLMLVGPVESNTNGDLLFPVLTPMPDVSSYQSSSIESSANRGRGQVYPSGMKSNSRNVMVKKSRNGRVLSRILGSNSDEIKLGVPTDESSSRDRRATKQKKVVKRFKRLLPAVIAKRLTVGSSLREGDEISGVTSFQGLGHAAGSIGLLEASRLKA
jgi:apocytochrome f